MAHQLAEELKMGSKPWEEAGRPGQTSQPPSEEATLLAPGDFRTETVGSLCLCTQFVVL